MAETVYIDIQFLPHLRKKLKVPSTTRVPIGSTVRFNLGSFGEPFFPYPFRGLIFKVYFENRSPFTWQTETLRVWGDPDFFYPKNPIKLAQGMANVKGEFKYGVQILDAPTEEPIYDEDPILIVL